MPWDLGCDVSVPNAYPRCGILVDILKGRLNIFPGLFIFNNTPGNKGDDTACLLLNRHHVDNHPKSRDFPIGQMTNECLVVKLPVVTQRKW